MEKVKEKLMTAPRRRQFNWNTPVVYDDKEYPSTFMDIEDANGNVRPRQVFANKDGIYYGFDNNGALQPVILQNNLDEVTVAGSKQRQLENLANALNKSLTTVSNDQTKVLNLPHREYNQHLMDNAVRGAEAHAAWDKENPNAAAWGNALAALPFVAMAYPFAAGAGEMLGATSFGADMMSMGRALMSTPAMKVINGGLGFLGLNEAKKDISQGKFTPETALDLAPFLQIARPVSTSIEKGVREASKYAKNGIVAGTARYSIQPSRMDAVNARFRNSEWNDFLATRNGDNYYRMVRPSQESYSPNEDYFVSHTTPWEEFVNTNSGVDPADLYNGRWAHSMTRLYEFPTATFGKRMATTSVGTVTNNDVSMMGKKHLLYGNTSSGKKDFVKHLSDKDAAYFKRSPYTIGIKDRPLAPNGLYDGIPDYENIHLGNQTVINGAELQNAILNSTYNLFEQSPYGIIRKIHIGK